MPIISPAQLTHRTDAITRLQSGVGVRQSGQLGQGVGQQSGFAASASLHQRQTELVQTLQSQNLSPQVMSHLMELSSLPHEQFAHVVFLAKALQNQENLFDRLAKTVKTIMARGENISEGVKTVLDTVDDILEIPLREILHQAHQQAEKQSTKQNALPAPQNQSTAQSKNSQALAGEKHPELASSYARTQLPQEADVSLHELEAQDVSRQVKMLMDKLVTGGPGTPRQKLEQFTQFSEKSVDEFPQRFTPDIFAEGQLLRKGLQPETYNKLSSEIPPLRLLNVILKAEKANQNPQAIFSSLAEAQNQGLPLDEQIASLEQRFAPTLPNSSMPNGKTLTPESHIVHLKSSENQTLDFLAMDPREGLLAESKTSFVIFPQRQEFAGPSLSLSQLPPGTYMILAKAVNDQREVISKWTKVIVEEEDIEDRKKRKNTSQDSEQDSQDDSQTAERKPYRPAEDVLVNVSGPLIPIGPFLGEITLPLDYLHFHPADLAVVGEGPGIIVSRDEFLNGTFANHSVTFRFLAEYADIPDKKTRQALVSLKPSQLFDAFDKDLRNYIQDPHNQHDAWKKSITEFFGHLHTLFPTGKETFRVAQEMFERESEAFTSGIPSSSLYEAHATEKDKKGFIASCYAKGGYALASASEVPGALKALSFATLTTPDDTQQKAALGQYVEQLRAKKYSGLSDESIRNIYAMHLQHSVNAPFQADSAYTTHGDRFLRAVKLALPEKIEEPKKRFDVAGKYLK